MTALQSPPVTALAIPEKRIDTAIGNLCIRADANSRIGVGHIMRCLALAQEWGRLGGRTCLVTTPPLPPSLCQRLDAENIQIQFLPRKPTLKDDFLTTAAAAEQLAAEWVVVDGYEFNNKYLIDLQSRGLKTLLIDDLGGRDLSSATMILNQNIYASKHLYPSYSNLLLGTKFTLLRQEFFKYRSKPQSQPPIARKILITMGGADYENTTTAVLNLLSKYKKTPLDLLVLAGPANPHVESLRKQCAGSHNISLLVDPKNVPEIMSSSDVVISAAGSSCWELAYLGLPMLLIVTAENQQLIAPGLEATGVAEVIGEGTSLMEQADLEKFSSLISDHPRRARMAANARELVDGLGASRVASAIISNFAASN